MAKMRETALLPPPIERGQMLTVTLGPMEGLGDCAVTVDGFPVAVTGGIPGERVAIEIVRVFRERAAARVVEVLEPSADRVAPGCPLFWPCTGCQWQHVRYDRQLAFKQEAVARAMQAQGLPLALPLWPTLPSPQTVGYRNHARFTIGPGGAVGYVNRATRQFLRVDACPIMHPGINQALAAMQGGSAETTQMSVRIGVNTGDVLVQPRMRNPDIKISTGQAAYTEAVLGHRFTVASPSFFQVNTRQAERMALLLRAHLEGGREHVLVDAYAGVGTFSVLLAPMVKRVYAIEESASAVRDAQQNTRSMENITLLQGKTEVLLSKLPERPDVLVLDPPRAGCQADALEAAVNLAPGLLLYVSCDPETLARDLAVLLQGPFRLAALYPVDMFPHTHHVECLAVLEVSNGPAPAQRQLVLASASPRRRELLGALGVPFTVAPSGVDESEAEEDDPQAYVGSLALAKALDVAAKMSHAIVLGADTTVVLDGKRLNKPTSVEEAVEMLRALRGRQHQVYTGIAVVDAETGRNVMHVQRSDVQMRAYSDEELETYVASGSPYDKAGGYAVQDGVFRPAERVDGCYFSVMGLPVCAVARLLSEFGVAVPQVALPRPDGSCRVCHLWGPIQPEGAA